MVWGLNLKTVHKTKPEHLKTGNGEKKKRKGPDVDCVGKGKKNGKKSANFRVAISKGKGVVLCKEYFGAITGRKFARITRTEFDGAFAASCNTDDKVFLQDSCPRQNSACARQALERKGGTTFRFPSWSPDLICIENFFVNKKLQTDTIDNNIEKHGDNGRTFNRSNQT